VERRYTDKDMEMPDVRDKTIDEAKKTEIKKSVVIMYTYEPEEQIMVEVPDVTKRKYLVEFVFLDTH